MDLRETSSAAFLSPARVESTLPTAYRMICVGGEFRFQGLFTWTEGENFGREWRTLETQYVETELTLDEFTPF